jgi:hypothetical protein
MIDSITLFQKHTLYSGNIHKIERENGEVYYIYSRKDLTEKELELAHEDDEISDILRTLVQKNGGGLIIQAMEQQTVVKITHISNREYTHPEKLFVLNPTGKRCEEKDINYDKANTYNSGTHIIIPVDKKHQTELEQFLNYLSWYTPDLESLVLHSIRNPFLELRVTSLEEELQMLKQQERIANVPSEKKGTFWIKTLFASFVVILLIAQLAISSLLFYKPNEQQSVAATPQTATTDKAAEIQKSIQQLMENLKAQPSNPPISLENLTYVINFDNIVSEFIDTLDELTKKSPENKALKTLWDKHFKGSENTESEKFVWGVAKLWLLLHSSEGTFEGNEEFLMGAGEYNATKKQFREYLKQKGVTDFSALPNIEIYQSMLAELACQIQHTSNKTMKYRGPGLPPIKVNKETDDEFVFDQNSQCDHFEPAKVARGLIALTKQMKTKL